jgi:hypothetical protein
MDPIIQAPGYFVVDLGAKSGQTAESRLDMTAGTAEPVVQVKVTKSGIEIVTPHQSNNAAAEPNTFGIAGWAVDGLGGFGEFVGSALIVASGIGGAGSRFGGLIGGCGCSTLGKYGANAENQCQPGNDQITQSRNMPVNYSLTHEFPNLVSANVPTAPHMPPK